MYVALDLKVVVSENTLQNAACKVREKKGKCRQQQQKLEKKKQSA